MQITFNEEKHELTVKYDDGVVKRFVLYDNLWEITYLILKMIDQLDDGKVQIDWDKQEPVPTEKLPENVVIKNEQGVIEGGLDSVVAEGDTIILHGGTASGDV